VVQTCKNMAKAAEESVLRQRSKNLCPFCNSSVNIIYGQWAIGIISCMKFHIYTGKSYLQK